MAATNDERETEGGSLLEREFPVREVSEIVSVDKRSRDPVYGVHRWWARRPPALMRAILIAASMDATRSVADFWSIYESEELPLAGLTVKDPFMGGGSTLVEAARLGADVIGGDVDPLSAEIVSYQLAPAQTSDLLAAGSRLLSHLRSRFGYLYGGTDEETPLHYFYLTIVTCPSCCASGYLYRNLVIARSIGKNGSVVRDTAVTAFCPVDLAIHDLPEQQESFLCCDKTHSLTDSSFSRATYLCWSCGSRSTHRDLQTGQCPQQLLAVERTHDEGRRRIASPSDRDLTDLAAAQELLSGDRRERPKGLIPSSSADSRPASYGITKYEKLFASRQLVVLREAFDWIESSDLAERVTQGLRLAVSNALASNNRLCGYAHDYGRLSPLFSIRGYSLPWLSVELNPLHAGGGRGTIHACVQRVARASRQSVARSVWNENQGAPERRTMELSTDHGHGKVSVTSASDITACDEGIADLVVFDPPYFDFIEYDHLSGFYRSWQSWNDEMGQPLLPGGDDPVATFGLSLGQALKNATTARRGGLPLVFTYHSKHEEAWSAVGIALDEAKLRVTALWPVRSDGHMGHHSRYEGSSEWDLVVVCRPIEETSAAAFGLTVDDYVRMVWPLTLNSADSAGIDHAVSMARQRYGHVHGGPD